MVLFNDFKTLAAHQDGMTDAFKARIAAGQESVAKFEAALETLTDDAKAAYEALSAKATTDAAAAFGAKNATAEVVRPLQEAAAKSQAELKSFLSGTSEYALGEGKTIKLHDDCAPAVRNAFIEAESKANGTFRAASNWFGGAVKADGWAGAVKGNYNKVVNGFKAEGFAPKGKAFAHGALVVAAPIAIVDGIVHSKNKDGEDRSGWVRAGEVLVGAAALTAALVGGRAAGALRNA